MTEHHRRLDDTVISKLVKLWPLILSFIVFVAAAATIKAKVENNETRINSHEERIIRLETDMTRVRDNTDLLVERLIKKK